MTATRPPQSPSPLVTALNREWLALADQPHAWPGDDLLGCGTWASLLDRIRAAPDLVLGRLLGLHGSGDRRAGRVVVQTMLGKMVLLGRADPEHDLDDYLAELWLRISTYPLARRPHRIAANLALDTRKAVRGANSPEWPTDPALLQPVRAEHFDDWTLAGLLRTARALELIDARTNECLLAVYGQGLRSHQAAERLGISPALVRYRTSRAKRTLATHAQDLVAATAA